ncbi:nucleotide-binding universal stress UspA family protein [Paraburkholderia sp. MM5384-R2]|nr:nucleotide-binding universal stress UspA family protein [Paraburkholderia sp. MM5384-R2]
MAENPRNIVPLGALTDAELQNARDEIHRDAADALQSAKSVFAGSKLPVQLDVIDLSRHGGYTGNALVDAANEWHADLLVVGARQHHGLLVTSRSKLGLSSRAMWREIARGVAH